MLQRARPCYPRERQRPMPDSAARRMLCRVQAPGRPRTLSRENTSHESSTPGWRTRRRLAPVLGQCQYTDLPLRRRRLALRVAAEDAPEFRRILTTFELWARAPHVGYAF
jgi:hypothetical protein